MSLLLTLLAACGSHTPSGGGEPAPVPAAVTAPASPVPAEDPAPENAAAATSRTTLTLDPEELSYDDAKGIATFSPGSRRQAADYTTYELDLESLEAALGGRPKEPVTVVVELGPPTVEKSTPADPNMPAPMGGFTYTTFQGKVVSKAP